MLLLMDHQDRFEFSSVENTTIPVLNLDHCFMSLTERKVEHFDRFVLPVVPIIMGNHEEYTNNVIVGFECDFEELGFVLIADITWILRDNSERFLKRGG